MDTKPEAGVHDRTYDCSSSVENCHFCSEMDTLFWNLIVFLLFLSEHRSLIYTLCCGQNSIALQCIADRSEMSEFTNPIFAKQCGLWKGGIWESEQSLNIYCTSLVDSSRKKTNGKIKERNIAKCFGHCMCVVLISCFICLATQNNKPVL